MLDFCLEIIMHELSLHPLAFIIQIIIITMCFFMHINNHYIRLEFPRRLIVKAWAVVDPTWLYVLTCGLVEIESHQGLGFPLFCER